MSTPLSQPVHSFDVLPPLPEGHSLSWGSTLTQSVREALRGITAHKLRAALTMLGIIVGICGVMLIDAFGRATTSMVANTNASAGANMVSISSTPLNVNGAQVGATNTLTEQDAQAVSQLPHVVALEVVVKSPQGWQSQVVAGAHNWSTVVQGVYPDVGAVPTSEMAQGSFLSAQDEASRATKIVLGATVAGKLFPGGGAVGQQVRVNAVDFTVEGVLRANSPGLVGGGNADDAVYVPFSTAVQRLMGAANTFGGMYLRVDQTQNMPGVVAAATKAIEQNHHIAPGAPNDFSVTNFSQAAGSATQTVGRIKLFLDGVAGLALALGGFGIVNVMLASVARRTREIGLRMAVGAQRKDVLLQFLLEGATLSLLGGLIGVAAGYALIVVLGQMLRSIASSGAQVLPGVDVVLLALAISVAVGIVFGYLPARRAAHLDPVQALRHG